MFLCVGLKGVSCAWCAVISSCTSEIWETDALLILFLESFRGRGLVGGVVAERALRLLRDEAGTSLGPPRTGDGSGRGASVRACARPPAGTQPLRL